MEQSKIAQQQELNALLNQYRHEYYNLNAPTVSDEVYDRLFDKLRELEQTTGVQMANSPTQTVGWPAVSKLEKTIHIVPLLSLDKTKSSAELVSFMGDQLIMLMLKLDGLTVKLTYEGGVLVEASTRGDGNEGEIITHNARGITGIPTQIPYKNRLVVSGEAFIRPSDFETLKTTLLDSTGKPYKNGRNLAAGSVRLLDAADCRERCVTFMPFNVLEGFTGKERKSDKLYYLPSLGFDLCKFMVANRPLKQAEIDDGIQLLKKYAEDNDVPIDGIVMTYNDIAYSKTCGRTGHHYKDGLAFKFEDDLFETRLQYIEWTPSRTGEIAPVAVFEPVEIDGCTVSRASLHNLSFIEGLELMPGNRVLVSKRNMIIPHVEENLDRGGFCMEQAIPGQCPCCGQPTRIHENNDTKTLFCDNPDCETRRLRKFVHFASQKAMDIEGLSEATIERLVGKLYRGLVQNAIAQCLGVPNLWNVKSKPDESRAFLETAEHSLHYPDYEYSYGLVSLLNGTPTDRKLTIGSRSLCTCYGQPHNDSSSLKCGTCESVIVCKECGSTVSRDSAHYMDGAFFCQDCVAQCELCGSWIRGAEVHQAISRGGRIVRLCEHCHTSATGTCDLCSSREICQIINAGRFCPHTEYAVAAAA